MLGTFFRRTLLVGLIAAPFACSGGDGESGGGTVQDDGSGGTSSTSASAQASNSATSGNTGGGTIMIEGEGTVVGLDGEPCVADVTTADPVDVDIHLMLDISSSMNDVISAGNSKWAAVVESLTEFVEDEETAEIGVGLQYFPRLRDGATISCVTNDDCDGGSGPCDSQVCTVPSSVQGYDLFGLDIEDVRGCADNGECEGGEACKASLGFCTDGVETTFVDDAERYLVCESDDDCGGTICDFIGFCQFADENGQPIGCSQYLSPCPQGAGSCVNPWQCLNATLCEASDYSTPAVEISTANNRNAAITASLADQQPNGLTPTAPALAGAIQHAQEWATDNPDRKVVAVLATDGLPTVCDPVEIADVSDIAQDGVEGSPSVSTYVIGVFSELEEQQAQSNLDQIAAAGGTDQAFVITTDSDVAGSFLAALNEIRGAALTCEFTIPEPPSGQSLDFGQVNLEFVDADGEARQLVNVNGEGDCADAPDEGWYYVRDDADNPIQISVCPDVCDEFQTTIGESQVNLQLGCATIIK